MLRKLVPERPTKLRQATEPLTCSDFRFPLNDILKLPLQENLLHTHLLDAFDLEDNVIITSLRLHLGHYGIIRLSSTKGLEDEFKVHRCQATRGRRPCAIVVFEELAPMTAVEIPSNQGEEFAVE